MVKFLFLILSVVSPIMTSCQSDEKYYIKEIKKNCNNPDIVEIERKEDYIEIEYMCNGLLYELVIDKKSDAQYTETSADISKVNESMMKKIRKNYPDWTIDEISQVIFNDTTLYKAELVKDGIEQNVYFTLTGKLYKAKNFLASDKWNENVLKNGSIYQNSPYNFFQPDQSFDLPDILNEISGISIKTNNQIFCIQDEIGSAFLYNLENEAVDEIYRFSDIGDFEDIVYNNNHLFILRSDGALFTIILSDYPKNITMQYLPLQSLNIEGLSYDKKTESLLVACHESNINNNPNERNIHRYYPKKKSGTLAQEINVSIDEINEYFKNNYSEIKQSTINFNPSAIGIHPVSGEYYILSATDRMIVVCDKQKKVKTIYALPSNIFYKPEGIDFLANGDMLISNEGTKNGLIKSNILFFKYSEKHPDK